MQVFGKKCLLSGVAALAFVAGTSASAAPIDSFENLDFDDSTQAIFPDGFDDPDYDVPGWTDYGAPLADSGIEFQGAWWNPFEEYSAFMAAGDAAYTMSTYTIQEGDLFTVSFYAKTWNTSGPAEWTATLFYDTPENVIGTYTIGGLTTTWTQYTDGTGIAATSASVGGTLGILFTSSGTNFANLDEPTVDVSTVPEPATLALLGLGGLCMVARRRSRG